MTMRCLRYLSLIPVLAAGPAAAAGSAPKLIDFPCTRNVADGRVLVDGTAWDRKMRELGYALADGSYVPYRVLKFTGTTVEDDIWTDGICRMQLLPVAK